VPGLPEGGQVAEVTSATGRLGTIRTSNGPVVSGWNGRKVARMMGLVLAEYGPVCHLCGRRISLVLPAGHKRGPSVDHVVPRKHWPAGVPGRDDLANLRPAHRDCNSRRGARLLSPALLARLAGPRSSSGAGFFGSGQTVGQLPRSPHPNQKINGSGPEAQS
jgi:5-methylcytosine-specific restriction endonuclease McrA